MVLGAFNVYLLDISDSVLLLSRSNFALAFSDNTYHLLESNYLTKFDH